MVKSHITKPMQRTAKARFHCVGCRPPSNFEARQLVLADDSVYVWVFSVESSRMALDSRAAANWRSLGG